MKKFARSCSAQIGQSSGAENNRRHAAAGSSRAAEFAGGNQMCGLGKPGPHLEYVQAMFDCENPRRSGNLAGESFAAVLENHPRYPNLRIGRDRALFERCDDIVADRAGGLREILLGLGFDDDGIAIYRAAALKAFRAAIPIN